MPHIEVFWTDENIAYMAEHGVTPQEVEEVLTHPIIEDESDSSGRPIVQGYTRKRRWLLVVFERLDEITVYPITAYAPEK